MFFEIFKTLFCYLTLAYGLLFIYLFWQKWRINSIKTQLAAHKTALLAGKTVIFQGREIDLDTTFIQYMCVASFVFVAGQFPTAYARPGSAYAALQKWLAVFFTLIFGWWGLFRGPIYTVQSLHLNLKRQGHLTNIAGMLPKDPAPKITPEENS